MITREEKIVTWGLALIILILLVWNVQSGRIQVNNVNLRITVIEGIILDMKKDVSVAVNKAEKAADKLVEETKAYKETQ